MGDFQTKCPNCGKETLYVISATIELDSKLEEDGFSTLGHSTTDELVRCRSCEHECDLGSLTN